jgi:hypothetical protein
MKKLFVVLVALALLFGMGGVAFATQAAVIAYGGGVGLGTLRTVTCVNNTAAATQTVLPVANVGISSTYTEPGIIPGKVKILGMDISVISPATLGAADVQDATSYTPNSGDIICEAEASSAVSFGRIWPSGMDLKFGLVVDQSAYTNVTIYYIQDLP